MIIEEISRHKCIMVFLSQYHKCFLRDLLCSECHLASLMKVTHTKQPILWQDTCELPVQACFPILLASITFFYFAIIWSRSQPLNSFTLEVPQNQVYYFSENILSKAYFEDYFNEEFLSQLNQQFSFKHFENL